MLYSHINPQKMRSRKKHRDINFTKQQKGCNTFFILLCLYFYTVIGHIYTRIKVKKKRNQQSKQNLLDGYLNPTPYTVDLM